jgi:hypothetical protein
MTGALVSRARAPAGSTSVERRSASFAKKNLPENIVAFARKGEISFAL